jgi:hypothetical protein
MNVIEKRSQDEFKDGASAGAAARQICLHLGIHNEAPTLKRLLEELLADANRSSFDRSQILRAFDEVNPDAATASRRESFSRNNATH